MLLLLNTLLLVAPAQAQDSGTLEVTVANGPGGRVYVDGQDSGKDTPATLDGLSAGNHMVQVKGNCLGAFAQVDVSPGRKTAVELTMEAKGGFAEIEVTPASAKVTVNDDPLSVPAAIELPCGEHRLEARAPGYVTETRIVTVDMGGAYRYSLELLADGYGTLIVDVTPDNAKIYLDGEKVATGDNPINQVRSGTHTLRVEAPGHQPKEMQVAVRPNEEQPLAVTLDATVATAPVDPIGAAPTPTEPAGINGKRLAGAVLIGAGAGAIVGGTAVFLGVREDYDTYLGMPEDTPEQESERDDYYDSYIRPKRAASYTLNILGGVAVAGGGLLLFIDDDGAVVGYTVRF